MFCGQCGTRNPRTSKFCRECGARLDEASGARPIPPEEFALPQGDETPVEEAAEAPEKERLEQASRAYREDRLEEAIDLCRQALTLNPKSVPAHRFLALLYEQQGNQARAIEEGEIVVKLNPDSLADQAILARLRGEKWQPSRRPGSWRTFLVPGLAGAGAFLLVFLLGSWIILRGTRSAEPSASNPASGAVPQAQGPSARLHPADAARSPSQPFTASPPSGATFPPRSATVSPAQTPTPAVSPPAQPARRAAVPPPPRVSASSSSRTEGTLPPTLPAPIVSATETVEARPVESYPVGPELVTTGSRPLAREGPAPIGESRFLPAESGSGPESPRAAGSGSWIRIAVKEGPAGTSSGPATAPGTASGPRPEPAPRPATREPQGGAGPSQPATEVRDLQAEARQHESAANRLMMEGRYREAMAQYRQALRLAPRSPRAGLVRQSIGLCEQKLGQHQQALETLRQAAQELQQAQNHGPASRAMEKALETTREAIKTSETYLQKEGIGKGGP